MITKPSEEEYRDRKPSQFTLWVATIYIGFFGLAFQRYENALNRLQVSYSSYIEKLSEDVSQDIFTGFINLQVRKIPIEAKILEPWKLLDWFTEYAPNDDILYDIGQMATTYFNPNIYYIGNLTTNGTLTIDKPSKPNSLEYSQLSINDSYINRLLVTSPDRVNLRLTDSSIPGIILQNAHLNIDLHNLNSEFIVMEDSHVRSLRHYIDLPPDSLKNQLPFRKMVIEDSFIYDIEFNVYNNPLYRNSQNASFIQTSLFYKARIKINSNIYTTQNTFVDSEIVFGRSESDSVIQRFINSNYLANTTVNGDYVNKMQLNDDQIMSLAMQFGEIVLLTIPNDYKPIDYYETIYPDNTVLDHVDESLRFPYHTGGGYANYYLHSKRRVINTE